MAEKDISERLLTSGNDVFADIVNGCLAMPGEGRGPYAGWMKAIDAPTCPFFENNMFIFQKMVI